MPGWQHDRRSRHERGYGRDWTKLRAQVMDRDKWLCQACGREGRVTTATEVDHVIPKCNGGDDQIENLSAICTACHAAKTAREAAEAQGRRTRPKIGPDGWPVD